MGNPSANVHQKVTEDRYKSMVNERIIKLKIKRLSWAGIKLEAQDIIAVIDPLENVSRLERLGLGPPLTDVVPIAEEATVNAVFVTHLHSGHYDPKGIRRCIAPDGRVFCMREIAGKIQSDGLTTQAVELYETVEIGGLKATPVPAVDGLGDHQASWVLECDGIRIIHCGDTLWHGYWWRIAKEYGPFDIAFLPINGPVMQFEGMLPSEVPAALTPVQAAQAAALLGARKTCPIHYKMFHNPPIYSEYPDALNEFISASVDRGVWALIAEPGEEIL